MSHIVSEIVSCEKQIHQFFLNQKIGSLLKRSKSDKQKGVSPIAVFRVLFTMAFADKNLFRTLETGGNCGMAKDTVYRFLNSVHTNWHRFLLLLSSRVIRQELEPLTGTANRKVLIFPPSRIFWDITLSGRPNGTVGHQTSKDRGIITKLWR